MSEQNHQSSVVSEPTGSAGVTHLHPTDPVERCRRRGSDQDQLVELNPLRAMTKRKTSQLGHRDGARTGCGSDESSPDGLASLSLACDSGRQIDRRSEPIDVSWDGRSVVQTSSGHREALEALAPLEQALQCRESGSRGLETQHHRVSQALHQLISGFERGASEVDEPLDLSESLFVPVDLGEGGEAG